MEGNIKPCLTPDPEQLDAVDRIVAQWARERPELDTGPMGVVGTAPPPCRPARRRAAAGVRRGRPGQRRLRRAGHPAARRAAVPAHRRRAGSEHDGDLGCGQQAARPARVERSWSSGRSAPSRCPRARDPADPRRDVGSPTRSSYATGRTRTGCSRRSTRTSASSSPGCCASCCSTSRAQPRVRSTRPGARARVLGAHDVGVAPGRARTAAARRAARSAGGSGWGPTTPARRAGRRAGSPAAAWTAPRAARCRRREVNSVRSPRAAS